MAERIKDIKNTGFYAEVDGKATNAADISDANWQAIQQSQAENTPLYYNKDGGYTVDPTEANWISRIDIDKDTNKITINAPKSLLNSDAFKQSYGSDTFRSIAKSYIDNPDNKLTLTDGTEKTVKELMEQYQDALNEMAEQRVKLDIVAKDQENLYGLTGLSDEQIITSTSFVDSKSKNTDAQKLPAQVIGGFDFSQFDSFNADNLTISKEDFDKFNQMRAFDDEHVKRAREEAMSAIQTLVQAGKDENYEYDEEGKEQAVRWQSFYNALESNHPKETAPAAIGNFTEFFIHGFGEVFTSLADNTGKLLEGVGENTWFINPVTSAGLQSIGDSLQVLAATGEMFDNLASSPELFTGDKAWDGFSKLLTDTKDILGINLSDEEQAKANQIEQDVANNVSLRTSVSGAAGLGNIAGSLVGEIVKQVVLVNPIGGKVASTVSEVGGNILASRGTATTISGLAKATQLVGKYGTPQELGSLAQVALNLTRSSAVLSQGEEVGLAVVSKLADVAMQGIADTITNDSEAMDKLYSSGDTSGIANELKSNFIWNAIGEFGAFGGSKIIEAIGETKGGKAIRLVTGKVTNELGALKNQAKLRVENIVGKWKGLSDSAGAGTRLYMEEIIDLEKQAAKAKTLEELESVIKARVNLENEFDNIIKGPRVEAAKMRANPVLGKAYSDYESAVTDFSSKILKAGDSIPQGSKVSQEAANYLSTKIQLSRAMAENPDGKWAKALQERYNNLATSLREKGLLEAADKNYDSLARLNYLQAEYAIKNYVLTEADIKSMRDTGYWGINEITFFHTRRINKGLGNAEDDLATTLSGYRNSVANSSYREFHATEAKNYKLSKADIEGDFIDPNVVIESEFYQIAKDIQGRQWGNALLNASGVNKTLGNVDELRTQARATKNLTDLQQRVLNNVRKSSGNDYQLVLDDLFPQVKQTRVENAAELKKISEDKAKATRSYNKAVDTYTGMQLDVNDLGEIEVGLGGRYYIPNFDPGQMTEESFQEMLGSLDKNTTSLLQSQLDSTLGAGSALSLDNYRVAYDTIEGLDTALKRSFITNDSKITKTKTYKDTIRRVKTENDNFRGAAFLDKYQTKYDNLVAKYADLKENPFGLKNGGKNFKGDVEDMVQGIRENMGARIKETEGGRQLLDSLVERGIDEDTAVQYLVVDTLNKARTEKDRALRDSILDYLEERKVNKASRVYGDVSSNDKQDFADAVADMADDIIESEWNTMTRSLIDNGYQDLVDLDEVFSRVEDYASDILGKVKDKSRNIIQILDTNGKLQFVETDPVIKDLYEWRPNYSDSTPRLFFSLTNRLFKTATSGWMSVKSLFTQGVKDPINTYVAGGAVPFMNRGMSRFFGGDAYAKVTDSIVESLQDRVIRSLKTELGSEGWEIFEQEAKAQGKSIGRAAVEYELVTRPQAIAGVGGTEAKFYQDISRARQVQNAYEYGGVIAGDQKANKFTEKLNEVVGKIEDASPANARETYLRNLVYGEQFQQAIGKGKSVEEARAIAERFMADATTNFSRPLAMGNRIARSIPYLSAAFNGKASFFRLLELDPAGITGRFFGGVILPYMALLGESLGKSDNAEIYKNIPESDKDGNLVFVINGVAAKIPIPEELAAFIAPFRQVVEKSADANDHSWVELMANDLLQLPAMDLSGFYDIDQNELTNNITFWGNVGRGFEKLIFGQMSPAIVKSTYMAITGRDPYYGNEIDRSYVYDAGDGTVQTMDSNDNKIAMAVSSWAKNFGISISPSAAYSIIGTTFGKGFLNLGDSLVSLLSGEPAGVGEATAKGVQGIFMSEIRDKAADNWREAVNQAYDRKEALIHSDEYQKYVQAINNTKISEDKRQEYISNWQTYTQSYVQDVVNMAKRMKENNGLTIGQQASVISLLTFADNTTPAFNANDRETASSTYYSARSVALETLNRLGFTGANDLSIFGYGTYVTNYETGEQEYKYKYNSPMSILDMGNVVWGQADITLANIKNLIEGDSNIKKDFNTFYQERSKLYDQASTEKDKKKKNAIYDQIDNMNEQWSNRVMRAIVPYIDNYGLDGLLNNREVISYLEKYIQVPSDLMGNAKYMSQSKTGLDKNAGFAQSYIKKWYQLYQKEQQKGNK